MGRCVCGLLGMLLYTFACAEAQLSFEAPKSSDTGAPLNEGPTIGKPYTAQKHVHVDKHLADGTETTQDSEVTEARDAQGLVATEIRPVGQARTNQPSSFELHIVFDPAARTLLIWNSSTFTANLIHLPAKTLALTTPDTHKPELLGHRTIAGLAATGTRVEAQEPGSAAGSTTPLRSTVVEWRSDALGAVLERTSTNPKSGTTTATLEALREGAPDAALFHVPAGYTVHDAPAPGTAAAAAPAVDHANLPTMTADEAMQQLDGPNAPVAAAVLVKLAAAEPDPALKDREIYAAARKGLELPAAEALAQADVNAGEQSLAAPNAASTPMPSAATLRAEHQLARYWDTLGFTLEREGKDGSQYLLAAWTLDPLAYYGSHLGKSYEQRHETAAAVAVYRAALSYSGSPEMKQQVRERLDSLAGPPSADTAMPAPVGSSTAKTIAAVAYSRSQAPQLHFVSATASGEQAISPAGKAVAEKAAAAWGLPDAGPERVVRLLEIDCAASDQCTVKNLPAHLP